MPLTWISWAIWRWFPLLTIISSEGEQWGRYNLTRFPPAREATPIVWRWLSMCEPWSGTYKNWHLKTKRSDWRSLPLSCHLIPFGYILQRSVPVCWRFADVSQCQVDSWDFYKCIKLLKLTHKIMQVCRYHGLFWEGRTLSHPVWLHPWSKQKYWFNKTVASGRAGIITMKPSDLWNENGKGIG